MARIKKGDQVYVLSGKDRGKTGKVLQVWPAPQQALVERVNLLKHFDRRNPKNQAGGIVEREGPLALSKLALFCPKCRKPSRVGFSVSGEAKQRLCRRCKAVI
ncbi:MAG: 50S ribosomal protein L24 [Candidatus Omnitrophica bacterium]|nr:50S ribosomal protein L24 [Candidatus Omnitrophota bacterium]